MTPDQAKDCVVQFVLQEQAESVKSGQRVQPRLYFIDSDLAANAIPETVKGPIGGGEVNFVSVNSQSPIRWPFFLDDVPEANWEHSCRYLFVHENGDITTVAESAPPSTRANYSIEEIELNPPHSDNR